MSVGNETLDRSEALSVGLGLGAPSAPGLILVFSAGRPAATPVALEGGEITLGRDHPAFARHADGRMSRSHARVRFDGRRFEVTDLESRNGTSADGVALERGAHREVGRVVRVGDSLLVPVGDLGPLARLGVRTDGARVEGPALQEVLAAVAHAARLGTTLHVTGESGAGKEGLARAFHAAGPAPGGPFQAVNCATIPEGVAERLLFGAKRGAFSGADADADGYVQAAHGGTLFLDEVAELSLPVQAKLLRVLETGEAMPLGATRPRRVELRFCSATHRDLRAQVAAGKLREDLFFRIATPRVTAPPLRDRPEEIAWLAGAELDRTAPALTVHASLVEACLLRPWPGNVRELIAEVRSAAQVALGAATTRIEARHLSATAGSAFASPDAASSRDSAPASAPTGAAPSPPTRAKIAGLLRRHAGNISAAARELGVARTQLKRWMDRHAIDPRAFLPGGRPPDEGPDG